MRGEESIVADCFSTVKCSAASAAMPSSCVSAADGGRMLKVSSVAAELPHRLDLAADKGVRGCRILAG